MFRVEVQQGIEWLNRIQPDWRDRVDVTKLDMASTTDCVLGQVFGMDFGRIMLDKTIPMSDKKAAAYGFDIHLDLATDGLSRSKGIYDLLTQQWVTAIMEER